jgi:hypothetical protein
VRPVASRIPAARAAGRVLLAVTSTALAGGIMAGSAGAATASVTGPAARTATMVVESGGCPQPGAGAIKDPNCPTCDPRGLDPCP